MPDSPANAGNPQTPETHDRARALDGLSRWSAISDFLDEAKEAGALDEATYQRLLLFLDTGFTPAAQQKPADSILPDRQQLVPSLPLEERLGTTIAPPVAASTPVEAPSLPSPPPARPAAPPEPSRIYTRLSKLWEAVASDVALHGIAYLGVLLTFIGVLGFLLFAFVDVPDAVQPFVELFMALIFFAWAWALRKQKADLAARGMELIGGMVLPLILFAGLVDNNPLPPDFEDGALVVALTVSALLLSGVYAWISSRHPDSMLRFLVAPLWWLAAMTVGFVFKTDEPLRSDAITRLVSAQPALASAAVAATLLGCKWRPDNRLAPPTMTAALVGAPVAYLLTVSLAVGENWAHTGPAVLLGIATFMSVELLAHHFGRTAQIVSLRPLLLAGVLIPLVPTVDIPWAGLVVTVAYIMLFQWTSRDEPGNVLALSLAGAGVLVGAVMTLEAPWPALVAYTILSLWANYRRHGPAMPKGFEADFAAVAALAPIGTGYALVQVLDGGIAWLVMASILAAGTVLVRSRRVDDPFWAYWLSEAAVVVVVGAFIFWNGAGREDLWAVGAVAGSAFTLGWGPRWPMGRLWLGSGLLALALAMVLETAAYPIAQRALLWASLGFVLVVIAGMWRRSPAGQVAALGHIMGLGSLLALAEGGTGALIAGLWSIGWIVSVVAAEIGGDSFTALLVRVAAYFAPPRQQQLAAGARWVAPMAMVGSIPPAVLAAANLWDEFAANRSWTGVTLAAIAVAYAIGARLVGKRRPLSTLVAIGAAGASAIGVVGAAPHRWPTIFALTAVIGVASILPRDLRLPGFVWFGWVTSFVLVLLLAEQAGVAGESLDLVSLGWGGAVLIGGLGLDDLRSGRRTPGEGLRVGWLRYPVVLGALAISASLGLVFARQPEGYGWWSLAAAAGLFVVAHLIRAGSVTAASYGLMAVGVTALSDGWLLDYPWRFVAIAAPLVLISWIAGRLQSTEIANTWLRWDLAPLAIAHLIGGFALAMAVTSGTLVSAGVAFGILSLIVGLWRRGRAWIEVGNLLVLASAFDAGSGWLTLALTGTALRGGIGAYLAKDTQRLSHQLTGALAGGLGWLAVIVWQGFSMLEAANYSAVLWGAFALGVASLGRFWRLKQDSVQVWGGVAVLAMTIDLVVAANPYGLGIDGLWFAVGTLMLAASFELAWRFVDPLLRYLSVVATGAGWVLLTVGLGWDIPKTSMVTPIVFGFLFLLVAEVLRVRPIVTPDVSSSLAVARAWATLGAVGVLASVGLELGEGEPTVAGYWVAGGLGFLAIGSARAAQPLVLTWLREASVIAALGSLSFLSFTAGWPEVWFAISVVVLGASSTFLSLAIWNRFPDSAWLRPLIVFGIAANLEAFGLAVDAWPARSLLVAILLSVGVQGVAVGLSRDRPGLLSAGPPLIGVAFILAISESISGSPQWYTAPIGVVVLSELEILRKVRRDRGDGLDRPDVLALEWAGIGLLVAPALVEMFSSGISYGLVAFAGAAACLLWAIVTRVRRRAVAAASIAIASAVLMIFAAAAAGSPESAFFWIVSVGVGFAMMLVAALVEAYRSRRGHLMMRIDQLMEGWE